MDGTTPLIGGRGFFELNDDLIPSPTFFMRGMFGRELNCLPFDVCSAVFEVDCNAWDSFHCLGDFLPVNDVISTLVFAGGIPEKGRLSCENDKLTCFGDVFPKFAFRLSLGLKIISPSECDKFISCSSGTFK